MNRILLLLINLWLVGIGDKSCTVATSAVHINDNITATAYSNGINLNCSFTLEIGEMFFAIALTAQNGTSDTFKEIAGFSKINSRPQLNGFGMDLFGNETTFEKSQNAFMLTFNNLTCRHERQYKCFLYVTTIDVLPTLIKSDTMWISVTVFPSKPEMHSPQKLNDFTNAKRNTRLATLAPKTGTHERYFTEGDNITFLCEGDVGRPEGRFLWQKMISSKEKINYSNISTETIPESCSFDGNSTLTIQVNGEDNQARIRCIVKSELPNGTRHEDSEPLLIHFKVRRPIIELFPDKTVFQEGDSVKLKCKANGNPNPSYSWTKGNRSEVIIIYNDILEINKANTSDTGLYTCAARNSIDGTDYFESMSTYIKIENISTTPSSATIYPSGDDKTQVKLVTYIAGSVAFLVLLFCIGMCVYWYRKKSYHTSCKHGLEKNIPKATNRQIIETESEGSHEKEDMYVDLQDGVYDKSGETPNKKENNCEHYDKATDISNASNKHITSKDTKLLDCNTRPEGKFKPGGYESVVFEGDILVLSPERKGFDREEVVIAKQPNTKNMNNQKRGEEATNASPILPQLVEYAQINEATKLKNINKHNDIDTQTVNRSAETQEDTQTVNRSAETQEDTQIVNRSAETQEDTPTVNRSAETQEDTQTVNRSLETEEDTQTVNRRQETQEDRQTVNRSPETQERIKVESGERHIKKNENAVNNSTNKPLANSEEKKQIKSKTANLQQGINNTSTRTVDNVGYFDTTKYLGEQQTNGGQEIFKRNDQTNMYTNQAFETDGDQ